MFKKLLVTALFFSVLTITTNAQEYCDGVFNDVGEDSSLCPYVEFLYHQDVVSESSCFNPKKPINRGEASKLIVKGLNLQASTTGESFPDVPSDHTFYKEIVTLKNSDAISGYPDGEFKPDEYITRGQFMKIIQNAVKHRRSNLFPNQSEDINNIFSDVSNDHTFAEHILNIYSVNFLSQDNNESKIINGYSDNTFRADNLITRAEGTKVVTNVMKYGKFENTRCSEYFCGEKFDGTIPLEGNRGMRVDIVGYSIEQKPIFAHNFGNGCEDILFVGAIHGNEDNTRDLMYEWIDELEANIDRIPENKRIIVIPSANPDGVAVNSRLNSNRVDLNRNFNDHDWQEQTYIGSVTHPHGGGKSPFSEVESQILRDISLNEFPELILTYHSAAAFSVPNGTNDGYESAKKYSEISGYRFTGDDDNSGFAYKITGSFEGWLGNKFGIPAVVIELESGDQSEFDRNRAAMWDVVER